MTQFRMVMLAGLAIATTFSSGCGGNAASDIRRYSRKRKPEAEQPAPVAAAPVAPADNVANAPPAEVPPPTTTPAAAPAIAPAQPGIAPPTTAGPPPVGPPPPIVMQNAKPNRPLDAAERWFRAVNNLEKVGAALQAYFKRNNSLPGSRFNGGLSWRVELLPYLGHDSLYKNFDLTASWDAPQNAALLKHIPPEYQSPERFDEKTNVLLATGRGCCGARTTLESFEDGMGRTILVVEGDEETAAPWTSPADFAVQQPAARRGLGKLRPEGALILLGDFRVLALSPDAQDVHVLGLFTRNGADGAFVADFCSLPANIEIRVAPQVVASAPNSVGVAPQSGMPADPSATQTPAEAISEKLELPTSLLGARADDRLTPPGDDERKQVAQVFRELYKEDYEAAKRPDERAKLVVKLLGETARVDADDTAYFVLNDIVRKMAVAIGDLPSFVTSVNNLERRYNVDGVALGVEGLTQIIPLVARNQQALSTAAQASEKLLLDAVQRDDFSSALKVADLQRAIALRMQDKNAVAEVAARRQELEAARVAFREAVAAAKTLESNPSDPKANEILGRYLTLVRNSWDAGLPLLAKADDVRLRFTATIDREPEKSPANMAVVGDKWWELAEELKPPYRRGAHLRAIHWYQAARPQLPGGLQKIRVEQRLSQSKKLYPELAAVKTEIAEE